MLLWREYGFEGAHELVSRLDGPVDDFFHKGNVMIARYVDHSKVAVAIVTIAMDD